MQNFLFLHFTNIHRNRFFDTLKKMEPTQNSKLIEKILQAVDDLKDQVSYHLQRDKALHPIEKESLLHALRHIYEMVFDMETKRLYPTDMDPTYPQTDSKPAQIPAEKADITTRTLNQLEDKAQQAEVSTPHPVSDQTAVDESNTTVNTESQTHKAPKKEIDIIPKPVSDKAAQPSPDLFSSFYSESIADKLAEQPDNSIAARLEQTAIPDLRQAIGINEKFLFINELFGGSLKAYNQAIEELNSFQSLNGARTYLIELSVAHSWPVESEAKEKLAQLIARKLEG